MGVYRHKGWLIDTSSTPHFKDYWEKAFGRPDEAPSILMEYLPDGVTKITGVGTLPEGLRKSTELELEAEYFPQVRVGETVLMTAG